MTAAAATVAAAAVVPVAVGVVAGNPHPYQLDLLLPTLREHRFYSVFTHIRHV